MADLHPTRRGRKLANAPVRGLYGRAPQCSQVATTALREALIHRGPEQSERVGGAEKFRLCTPKVYKNGILLNVVEHKTSKLNLLWRNLPEGLVVDAAWLENEGIASNLRSYYATTGWLEQPARGVYRRSRGNLRWQQVVISLQTMLHKPFHVGGRTSLELQGFGHYLGFEQKQVHLYGPERPPGWLGVLSLPQAFIVHNSGRLFPSTPSARASDSDVTQVGWGQEDWSLTVSSPERAYLELLDELPHRESFDQADMIMQGASNFRPGVLHRLLLTCTSVKVKRLFFFFADRHQHAWRRRLTTEGIDLGKGKRQLVTGGRLDPVYLITVPETLDALS
jgi:hypothetical protein